MARVLDVARTGARCLCSSRRDVLPDPLEHCDVLRLQPPRGGYPLSAAISSQRCDVRPRPSLGGQPVFEVLQEKGRGPFHGRDAVLVFISVERGGCSRAAM